MNGGDVWRGRLCLWKWRETSAICEIFQYVLRRSSSFYTHDIGEVVSAVERKDVGGACDKRADEAAKR